MRWGTLLLKIPENWMTDLVINDSNKIEKIQVLSCRPYKYRGGTGIVKIISKENHANDVTSFINNHENVLNSKFHQISDKILIGEITLEKCSACIALNKSECFMISSQSKRNCIQWVVAGEQNRDIYNLLDYLKQYGCEAQLLKVSSPDTFDMTDRQKEILRYAFYHGYFEHPKKILLKDVSKAFNIAASTASEILKGGQRKIFAEYFRE